MTINLQPLPIYGSLDIMTNPSGATITVNGKNYGTSPNTVNQLLIGNYTVELSKAGYATVKKEVVVAAGKAVMLSETLADGRQVTINSTPQGANLYVDGIFMGKTPYNNNLTFGSHTLKIEKEGKTATKNITIAQAGGETYFDLSFLPEVFTENVSGVNIDMVYIKEGTFMMGSPTNEKGRDSDETQHQVSLSGFYMGKYAVTTAQFKVFIDETNYKTDADKGGGSYIWSGSGWTKKNGVNWRSDVNGNTRPPSEYNHPVIHISWNDAVAYCNWLSRKTSKTYRLPTEAEWEYACRAGTTTPFNTGENLTTAQANYNGNYPYNNTAIGENRKKTLDVGSFAPNAWGLHDMHGNVWEWCNDWYGKYKKDCQTNPKGPNSGSDRVLRGGSWYSNARYCRSADRNVNYFPGNRSSGNGFRVVLVP